MDVYVCASYKAYLSFCQMSRMRMLAMRAQVDTLASQAPLAPSHPLVHVSVEVTSLVIREGGVGREREREVDMEMEEAENSSTKLRDFERYCVVHVVFQSMWGEGTHNGIGPLCLYSPGF